MHILVANDDGYLAPGLLALVKALRPLGRVTVIGPEQNHSGASNSLTLSRPLTVNRVSGGERDGFIYINGTPTDCVHIALTGLLDTKPDIVVSGINQGENMGEDVLYSGTVAAAIEGVMFGIPAIAFSQVDKGWIGLEDAALIAKDIVLKQINHPVDYYKCYVNPNEIEMGAIQPEVISTWQTTESSVRIERPMDKIKKIVIIKIFHIRNQILAYFC